MTKIAIPTGEKNDKARIFDRFARAPWFCIVNADTNEVEWWENNVTGAHGAGPFVIQALAEKEINVIVAPQLGTNGTQAAQVTKMEAFTARDMNIEEIVNAYKNNELERL